MRLFYCTKRKEYYMDIGIITGPSVRDLLNYAESFLRTLGISQSDDRYLDLLNDCRIVYVDTAGKLNKRSLVTIRENLDVEHPYGTIVLKDFLTYIR